MKELNSSIILKQCIHLNNNECPEWDSIHWKYYFLWNVWNWESYLMQLFSLKYQIKKIYIYIFAYTHCIYKCICFPLCVVFNDIPLFSTYKLATITHIKLQYFHLFQLCICSRGISIINLHIQKSSHRKFDQKYSLVDNTVQFSMLF